MILISRHCLGIKAKRLHDLDRISTMRAQEKFRIVEIIKVIDRCSCAEFDSLDLLKIDVEYSLLSRCLTAIFYPLECLFYAVPELPVE